MKHKIMLLQCALHVSLVISGITTFTSGLMMDQYGQLHLQHKPKTD